MRITILSLFALVLASWGEEFAVTLEDGHSLTWNQVLTESITNPVYQVEWKSTLEGEWRTDSPFEPIESDAATITQEIPRYFRVVVMDAETLYRASKERYYENTYIVTFTATDKADAQTVSGLLDCLHDNQIEGSWWTHHFRTTPNEEHDALIGKMCVNDRYGLIDEYVAGLIASEGITFLSITAPTFDEFIAHTKTSQEKL